MTPSPNPAAHLYLILFNAILTNPSNIAHGCEGIYFVENAKYMRYELAKATSEVPVELGNGVMSSVRRSSSLDWKKDWSQTEPQLQRVDHWLQLHKFWIFSVASCKACQKIKKKKTEKNRSKPSCN